VDDDDVCLDLALESTRRCLASEDAEEKDEVLEHLLGREIWSEEQAEEYRCARYRARAEADE
jgi:hypothetical protein